MPVTFNANEIFEIAEEIERNGAGFYRKAAEQTSDKETKQLLGDMAAIEDGHLETFKSMRAELSGEDIGWTVFDPNNEAALYLQAIADARGWEGKVSPTEPLTGNETTTEILETALCSEKESVLFYFGLKALVPDNAGKDKVENIIIEELKHITTILEKLKASG